MLQEVRNYLMFIQKPAWFWCMVFKHRIEREDGQPKSHQNPQLSNSISMALLWKFQRPQVQALWVVSSKLQYRLTELFVQVAPACKHSSLSQPRISLFYLNICTNLLFPFFRSSLFVTSLGRGLKYRAQCAGEVRAMGLLSTLREVQTQSERAHTTLVFLAVIFFLLPLQFPLF